MKKNKNFSNKIFGAKKINRGFTLIEVMIALLVFGIGLVTILGMVVYNITLSDNIKSQVSGTLLAKEGIEIIYNNKESNKKKDFAWNVLSIDGSDSVGYNPKESFDVKDNGKTKFVVSQSFDKDKGFGRYQIENVSNLAGSDFDNKIKLYINTEPSIPNFSGYYSNFPNPAPNSKPSFFSRYVQFDKVQDIAGDEDNSDKIVKLTSKVLINKGRKREINIETFMGNN